MAERKKPGVAFWATVVVVGTVGLTFMYVGSFAAVLCLHSYRMLPDSAADIAEIVYAPIGWFLEWIGFTLG
jgi:hypothetical protein